MGKPNPMVGFRLDEETKKKLQEIADEEGRTLSNIIKKLISDYIKKYEDYKKTFK